MARKMKTMDGNNAAAYVSYAFTDVAAIYPITPSSVMADETDKFAANGVKNLFGREVQVTRCSLSRRCWCGARLLAGRCSDHHLYCFSGLAADDPEYVQNGRRAAAQRHSRIRTRHHQPCPFHFWRPF